MGGTTREDKEREAESGRQETNKDTRNGVLYSVEDTPPWYLCLLLGFQVRLFR